MNLLKALRLKKRGWLFLTFLLVFLLTQNPASRYVYSQSSQPTVSLQLTAEDYFNRGNHRASSGLGNYEGAVEDYNRALQLNPSYAAAYFERGRACEYSWWNLKEHIGKNWFAQQYIKWGRLCEWNNDAPGGLDDFKQAIEIHPDYVEAYYQRGRSLYRRESWHEAITDFGIVIQADPNNAAAYFYRGLTYSKSGNELKALEDYREVIRLDPSGLAYRNDNLKTIADYSDLIKQDFDFASNYYRGVAYFFAKSAILFEEAGVSYPVDNEEFNEFYWSTGFLDRAIRINPEYANAYYFRGRARSGEEAISDFTQALDLNPEFPEAYYFRAFSSISTFGEVEVQVEKVEEVLSDLSMAIEQAPHSSEAYYYRGMIQLQSQNLAAGFRDLIEAIKIEPTAYVYDQESPETYISSLNLRPQDAFSYYERGKTRAKLKNLTGAIEDYTRAIDLNPDFAEAYYRRGIALDSEPLFGGWYDSLEKAFEDFTKALDIGV
jgi:tetratricopeptide (TPR) repeat protein